jgi:hypothetical protein
LDSGLHEPMGRTAEVPQGIDDFTIVLPEWTDVATCKLEVYGGLDQLWRMVERYKMAAPIALRVVDNKAICVRAIRGDRHQATAWQLRDETSSVKPPLGDEIESPLTINAQDAKGNILKMRLQLRASN